MAKINFLKIMTILLLSLGVMHSSFAKSDKRKLKDSCKTYENKNKNSKCIVTKKKCSDKKIGNGWKAHGKKKGKYRMCVRSDCDRKCRRNLKNQCKTFEKKNKGSKCKIKKTKKGCSKPWKNHGKAVGDYRMCTKKKCDRKCKDKKGKNAAKKICKEIKKSSGRPCKVVEAKIYKRDKKACENGWVKQDKVRYVEGYNANNYIICVKKKYNAAKANSLGGSSSPYDDGITNAINYGIQTNLDLTSIENDLNKEICKLLEKYHKPDPRVEIAKCKNNSSPGFRLGRALPSVTIKNAALVGKKVEFDYLVKWKTNGLNLNYKIETKCKVRKKKNKGRKKDWKCPDVKLRLKDFSLSLVGKGTATASRSGSYSYDLDNDEKSFKHSARFSACVKIIGKYKFCPGKVERAVSDTLKTELLRALDGI